MDIRSSELAEIYQQIRHMGTLLKQKFDFSGVEGIQKAFAGLFGKDLMQKVWTSEMHADLFTLEQCRHLIQHRAGVIHQKFLSATSRTAELGVKLTLSKRSIST